jgi:phage terminase large subunit-like protein
LSTPRYGITEPRIWTKPLVELTPETSRGFAVIKFAREDLGVRLLPWQEWLLIHMLELDSFGLLRFRKALVIVGRQNGKTAIAAVLAAYWMYVDAGRWPEQLPEQDFIIVGAAQKLDVAMKPWKQVRRWGAPDDLKVGIAHDRRPELQKLTYPPRTVNGETDIRTVGGGTYMPRTFEGARGHSAARLLLDELRQQYDYDGWAAIEKSANAMFDSFLVAFSNAGTARSTVLKDVRDIATEGTDDPDTEWFIAEWSAEQKAPLDDPVAFAQANPSAGHLPGMTIAGLMRTAAKAKNKNVERVEVLGQWVTSLVTPYLDVQMWQASTDAPLLDEDGELVLTGSQVSDSSRMVMGIDVHREKRLTRSSIAVAGYRDDGRVHLELIAQRTGMSWVLKHAKAVRAKTGITQVAIQTKGCDAADLVAELRAAGFDIVDISATTLLISAGRLRDRLREDKIRHRGQGPLDLAVDNGATRTLGGMDIWDRDAGPVDISPLVAVTFALVGLESFIPAPPEEVPPPPPKATTLQRARGGDATRVRGESLRTLLF